MVRTYVTALVVMVFLLILLTVHSLPQTEVDCSAPVEAACQRAFAGCLNACTSDGTKCQQACSYARGLCR